MVDEAPIQPADAYEGENAGKIFSRHAASGRPAIIDVSRPDMPRQITYDALESNCDAVARALAASGLGVGGRIGILSLNRIEYLEVLFGAMRAGIVAVPLNNKLPPDDIEFVARDAGVEIIFCDALHRVLCPAGPRCVDFDDSGPDGYSGFIDPGIFEAVSPDPRLPAVQPYTSGSTGRPKGVLLGHAGQVWYTRTGVADRGQTTDDVILVAAPLCHKNALGNMKVILASGARAVLLSRFDAALFITCIERYRVTRITGVPPMMALLLAQKDLLARTDLSSITHIGMGSAPASDDLFVQLLAAFPNARLSFNFGTTEGGLVPFGSNHPKNCERPLKSIGTPLPGSEVRLVGGPDSDQGVLHLHNPGVMLGYHNLADETAARLRDGWYDTGDIMRRDADGWYYFVERGDDMFVCGAENVYPGEVESLVERHPEISQAAVIGVDDPIKGAVPHAFVVRERGSTLGEEDVKAFALANGPAYAHPRRVHFLDALPLTVSNKVDRQTLVQWAADARDKDHP